MPFAVAAASVRGPAHIDQQQPNQDAVLLRGQRAGWVAAVCDGLGSAKQSDIGAMAAARAVRQVLSDAGATDASTVNAAIHTRWRAQTAAYPARDVATTCLWLSIHLDGSATFAQLGDGLILFRQNGQFFRLTPPRQGYGNQTHALHTAHAPAQWQQAACTLSKPGDGVVLMTDGVSDDLVPEALDGFYQALFNNVRRRSRRNARRWLRQELKTWSTPLHGDDKSLVAIFKTR